MNSINILYKENFPLLLKEMSDPPDKLYIRGVLPSAEHVFLTVVGSRRYSAYGKEVTEMLIESLHGLPVVIVSGLAYGIDAIAHRAALDADLKTVAIPGSGLDDSVLYPRDNFALAEEILRRGGALISPFENTLPAAPWTFPNRNRIMAGISHATLVIEADIRSGTLITSRYAGDFNRNILAVPGSILNSKSAGPHMLLKIGATPITCGNDLIEALGFKVERQQKTLNLEHLTDDERTILSTLENPLPREVLYEKTGLDASKTSVALSLLEIKGLITESLGEIRKVC